MNLTLGRIRFHPGKFAETLMVRENAVTNFNGKLVVFGDQPNNQKIKFGHGFFMQLAVEI